MPPTNTPASPAGDSTEAQVRQAAAALAANRPQQAELILRDLLEREPFHAGAVALLAEVAARALRLEDAEALLQRALASEPGNAPARHRLAVILWQQSKWDEALAQVETLLAQAPADLQVRDLKASILAQAGRLDEALAAYEALLAEQPDLPHSWMRYANALRTAGRGEDCIAAYARAAALKPDLGEAYCSLANLKTYRFESGEIAAMRAQLARAELGREDRAAFHFALGKALEDEANYEESFEHYAQGNAMWRQGVAHNAASTSALMAAIREVFDADFFAARAGFGSPAPDPIFIVGMPRSGSTLVEQILASHSAIEGTGELNEIIEIARRLNERPERYPAAARNLTASTAAALGEAYLARTRPHRRTGRPFFIDKMPNNFAHAGLIHLILPNAKIVDVRRGAMACCFANFSHHFARGQQFTYELSELGRYYADYVALMAHFERVLPGRIHRVQYEALVANPESEIRKLFDYLGLPFEDATLRFFETARPVRSASSEQVRRPIFTSSLERWRHYEPWLGPLKSALGPLAEKKSL